MIDHTQNSSSGVSLDLSQAPAVIYFFGLAGGGKTYVADVLARLSGRHAYHADKDLTPEMRQAVVERRTFTPEMRDRYFEIVVTRILELRRSFGPLLVTQATYKKIHRERIASQVPDLEFVQIVAPDELIVERLQRRGDFVTPGYAATIRANFEPPPEDSKTLINDEDEQKIVNEIKRIYNVRS